MDLIHYYPQSNLLMIIGPYIVSISIIQIILYINLNNNNLQYYAVCT
jgi:hypothetical protein